MLAAVIGAGADGSAADASGAGVGAPAGAGGAQLHKAPTAVAMVVAPVGSCNGTPKACAGGSRIDDDAEVAINEAAGGKKVGGKEPSAGAADEGEAP